MPSEETSFGKPSQWMRHARSDLAMAKMPLPIHGLYAHLCFHAQQAADKALKAVLVSHDIEPPYTHNLQKLIDLLPPTISTNPDILAAVRITAYAVASRYPEQEEPIGEEDHREAVRMAEAVVEWADDCLRGNGPGQ